MASDKTQRLDVVEEPVVTERTQRLDAIEEPATTEKTGLLSKVSLPTALAAALTAATSFLFSARLGLTGSLIGAAIGAVVSTIASQIYNAMIDKSVEKLQDLTNEIHLHREEAAAAEAAALDKTMVRPLPPELLEHDATSQLAGAPISSDMLPEEVVRRHRRRLVILAFVGTVVASLVALGIYAAVLNVATQGQGIGPKSVTEVTKQEEPVQQEDASATATTDQKSEEAAATETTPQETTEQAAPETPTEETQVAPESTEPTAETQEPTVPEQTEPQVDPQPVEEPTAGTETSGEGTDVASTAEGAVPAVDEG